MNKSYKPKFVNARTSRNRNLDDEVISMLLSLSIVSRNLAKRMIIRSLDDERKRGRTYGQV